MIQNPNVIAFLSLIAWAEGTDREPDPYRVCYGYKHTIIDLCEHPAITKEWMGEKLPDAMCRKAGLKPPCKSTAAGRYQMIKATWITCRDALRLTDFGVNAQDAAAIHLIAKRGAIADVQAGRVADAVRKCRAEWASLPGNTAGQPQRAFAALQEAYIAAGGKLA